MLSTLVFCVILTVYQWRKSHIQSCCLELFGTCKEHREIVRIPCFVAVVGGVGVFGALRSFTLHLSVVQQTETQEVMET